MNSNAGEIVPNCIGRMMPWRPAGLRTTTGAAVSAQAGATGAKLRRYVIDKRHRRNRNRRPCNSCF
jgi:hypothetical protein